HCAGPRAELRAAARAQPAKTRAPARHLRMVILPASRHFCRRSFFGAQAIRPAGPRQSWVAAIGGGLRWALSSYPADGTDEERSGAWRIVAAQPPTEGRAIAFPERNDFAGER